MSGQAAGRYVGQSIKRKEDPRLLTGQGRYVDDIQLPNTAHVAFVRSNIARGKITNLDISEALQVPGVIAIYTGEDLNPYIKEYWHTMGGPRPALDDPSGAHPPASVLAPGDVRFVGDPIAMVIAENRYVAEDAAEMVIVDIDAEEPIIGLDMAVANPEMKVHHELNKNFSGIMPYMEVPPVDEMMASAPHVVTRRFKQARATNVPMEPRGIIVKHDRGANEITIWSATQNAHEVRSFCARLIGFPAQRIRAIAGDVGGGFGQKMMVSRDEAAMMIAGYLLGDRPIKWIEDRRESLIAANQAREEWVDVTMAVTPEGDIMGCRVNFLEDVGAYPPGAGGGAGMSAGMFPGPYKMPVVIPQGASYFTNTCGKAPYRGPWMMETVAREQMMDHVAAEIGIDPIEFRRRNIIHQSDLPYTTCTTLVYDVVTPEETLDQAMEMLDLAKFRAEQEKARTEGRLLGLGVGVYIEPSAIAFGILSSDQANVRMDESGKVLVALSSGSHGHSIETTMPQVIAEHLGCDIDDIIIMQGDTASAPIGPGTGGSRTAVIVGGACQTAAGKLKAKILEIAAHTLEANVDDLEVNDSVVSVKGTPAKQLPFAQIAAMAYMMPEMLPEGMEMGLEVSARYKPAGSFTYSNATHACTVEVDPKTGMVKILRYIVSEDCGQMINPMVVEGQIAGGVVQGIGGVLFEHMIYDKDGNPLATTFLDYLVPTAPEIPDIEYGHIQTMSNSLGGYKGMGEGGAIVSPPTVANAIHDAVKHLGVHPTDFPLGPSQIRDLLVHAGAAV